MMWLLGMILAGLIIGAIARLVMPGTESGGIVFTIILGIAGSVIAGWVGSALGIYQPGEAAGWIMSILGAFVLLAIYRAILRRRTPGGRIRRAA